MKSYKEIAEALKGKQHKIDVDKDGKIEGEDLAKLRAMKKEEVENIEEKKVPEPTGDLKDACWKGYTAVGMKMKDGRKVPNCVPVKEEKDEDENEERVARSDYKISPSGRKSHKEIVFKHGDDKKEIEEAAPPGFEGTVKAMKKHKDIDNPYALAWSMYKKGYQSHKKADGTMKEEAEQIDEKSDQAKQNKTMKNLMAASKGAQINRGLKLDPAEYGYKRAQNLNVAIGRAAMRAEETEQLEEGLKQKLAAATVAGTMAMTAGHARATEKPAEPTTQTQKADAKDNKQTASPDEAGKTKLNLRPSFKRNSTVKEETKKQQPPFAGPYKKVSGTVTDKSGAKHTPMSNARHLARMAMQKQMNKEEVETIEEKAPVAPAPGDKWKSHAVMVHPETKKRVVVQRSNAKNYPASEGWKEVSPGQKIKENEDEKFSYKELMMMLEYESASGVYRHKGTYGSEFAKKEREKDEKGFDAEEKPTTNLTKRGRGRPAGSKSGARGPRIK